LKSPLNCGQRPYFRLVRLTWNGITTNKIIIWTSCRHLCEFMVETEIQSYNVGNFIYMPVHLPLKTTNHMRSQITKKTSYTQGSFLYNQAIHIQFQ
jgi:hypothetical protein